MDGIDVFLRTIFEEIGFKWTKLTTSKKISVGRPDIGYVEETYVQHCHSV